MSVVRPAGEDLLEIRLRDYGNQVAPEQIRSRDLDDVRPGGLGVHIIQECMDTVEYRPAETGGTLLILQRRLGACEQGADDE